MSRQSWDQYFFDITKMVGERGTCNRGRSGAIIVIDKRIVATGYVGSPKGMPHCDDVGHQMRDVIDENGQRSSHCVRTIHAEENAILQAASFGISLRGGTIYCKMTPCFNCARMITQVGIIRVAAMKRYHADKSSVELFQELNIQLNVLEDEVENYERQ